MTKQEIEWHFANEWFKYNNGQISGAVLREHVEHFASHMEKIDAVRADEMRYSVVGY